MAKEYPQETTMENVSEERRRKKLAKLAEENGTTVGEMLEEAICDGACPAICIRDGCSYSTEYEPDQCAGWCEECEANTVVSCLVLAHII